MLDFSSIPDGPSIPAGYVDLSYGTSGFRSNSLFPPNNLDHVAYRCGLLFASIPFFSDEYYKKYSNFLDSYNRFALGIVITASHNPSCDNGIKLFSPSGHMLESDWEPYFTSFINTRNPIQSELCDLFVKFNYQPKSLNLNILIGWDTRPSFQSLASNLTLGIESVFSLLNLTDSKVKLVGSITSPCISYMLSSSDIDVDDDENYLTSLNDSFMKVIMKFQTLGFIDLEHNEPHEELFFDCAYGVGGYKIMKFFDVFRYLGLVPHACNLHQFGTDADLNNKCGASYIFSSSYFPENLKANIRKYFGKRFCSFDGDVDRVLYYMPNDLTMTPDNEYKVLVLNGDRLIIVKMMVLWTLLKNHKKKLRIGILLTRYSNGSAVRFINSLISKWNLENPNITWVQEYFNTGIKNAERLSQNYYISIYYETNGHGNIVFNRSFFDKQDSRPSYDSDFALNKFNTKFIKDFKARLDPYVTSNDPIFRDKFSESLLFDFLFLFFPGGDAILNSLVIELAFKVLKLSFDDCFKLYTDMPCSLWKYEVPIELRNLFVSSTENETLLVEPEGFQDKIDSKVKEYDLCFAFLRPSGTEPTLRIYVEAENNDVVKEVLDYIIKLIDDFLAKYR